MSLRVVAIALDKETWDNVAPIILKSFNVCATNTTALKKWADKQEDRVRRCEETHKELEGRVDSGNASLTETRARLEEVAGQLQATTDLQKQQVGDLAEVLGRLLTCSGSLLRHLSAAFGGGGEEDESPGGVNAHAVPQSQRTSLPMSASATLPSRGSASAAAAMAARGSRGGGDSAADSRSGSKTGSSSGARQRTAARANGGARAAGATGELRSDLSAGELPHGRGLEEMMPTLTSELPEEALSDWASEHPPAEAPGEGLLGEGGLGGGGDDCLHGASVEEATVLVDSEDPISRLLPELQASGAEVEGGLIQLTDVMALWGRQRKAEGQQRRAMSSTILELQTASEKTFERLLTWRGLLKESSHAIDALGQSLAGTQSVVRELKETQVRQEDVDEAVSASARQLHELHEQTERHVAGLGQRVDAHVVETERLIVQTRKQMEERIDDHGAQLVRMLEKNLSPVNAYLNRMHVKADAARAELDALNVRVPKLAMRIDEVADELRICDELTRTRADELTGKVDSLTTSVGELQAGAERHEHELIGGLEGARQEFGGQLGEVRSSLSRTAGELESLRANDVGTISKNVSSLEQKVAKWVHALPLPAKVSEARLFSLEARLAEETDARLNIEHQVGLKGGRFSLALTPRQLDGSILPQLPGDGPGGRTAMYDAYRQSQHTSRQGSSHYG